MMNHSTCIFKLNCFRNSSVARIDFKPQTMYKNKYIGLFFKRFYLFILDRREGREKEEEKYQCVVASRAPPTGDLTWPTTQACALTGNQTSTFWFTGQHSVHLATPAR